MRLLTPIAAALMLAATPAAVLAQEAAQDVAPPSGAPGEAAQADSPEEAALEAKGEAFEAQMNQMSAELEAIVGDPTKDAATATAEADAVVDRYAPGMTAFAAEVEAFLKAEADKPENADKKDEMVAAGAQAAAAISAIPDQVRAGVRRGIAERDAALTTTPAPTPAPAPAAPQ